jgi:hypothetical protein
MRRLWLAALAAVAGIGCGDDSTGPGASFPDVAGVYAIEGEFDDADPEDVFFTGTVTVTQESLESSILGGSADINLTTPTGVLAINDAELLDASVTLAGVVTFRVESPGNDISWTFTGERAGDVLEGTQTITQGSESETGPWTGSR